MNHLKQTELFRRATHLSVANTQSVPTVAERVLNLKLLFEELKELAGAYGLDYTFSKICVDHGTQSNYYCGNITTELSGLDSKQYDAVEALDALADIQVVLDGAVLTSGLQHVFKDAMTEVFASNISKASIPYSEALQDQLAYANSGINVTLYGGGEGAWVLRREPDGKLMKPARFIAPNLHQFIQS